MITISKERLQWLANISGRDDIDDIDGGEIRELALIALASLEAEPVAVNDDMAYAFHHALSDSSLGSDEIVEMAMRKAGNSPVTPARLPGGFTIEDAKELHEDLVRSHISQALSGEKMKKKDRDADLRWIHGVIVQAAWFVKASLEKNALSGTPPVTPDGWISCSERMPDTKTAVLVAVEFDRKGDWRMKWATYIPGHPDANDGWIIPGASWKPSHWMPLPEPPQEAK
ncbi:TPA: DUF551 domain-containing protein [Escherichia coli]|nr:DUF551 domain-containing protein [Escherichia coli]HDR7815417.1 DUF551 domain-containing protein [Escherichia coli]